MIRLSSRGPIPPELRGAILALGNFDGYHLGHQAVVGEALRWAKAEGRPCIIATFDPHPVRFFAPDAPPFRLTSLDQRQDLFAAAGADAMLVFHFDSAMAATPAESWVRDVIAGHIGAGGVVTGADFTFGKGRGGNADLLKTLGAEVGLSARALGPVLDGGASVSSSRIREALAAGDPATATRLLTRPFAVRGRVQKGAQLGRTIGYPTANLEMAHYLRPAYGIYAVRARVLNGAFAGRELLGAANFGIRPMFDPPLELLEPTFFDFSGDLYAAEIEVSFAHYLRGEAKFDTLDALKQQIERDCETARNLLSANHDRA